MGEITKMGLKFIAVQIIIYALITIIFQNVLMLSYIPSGSMEGTLMAGDYLLSSRYDVGAEDINRFTDAGSIV